MRHDILAQGVPSADQFATVQLFPNHLRRGGRPGHLEELTRQLPFDLIDAVVAGTGAVEHRLQVLPSSAAVDFLLALGKSATWSTYGCGRR